MRSSDVRSLEANGGGARRGEGMNSYGGDSENCEVDLKGNDD